MKPIATLLMMTAGLIGLAMISAPAHAQQADFTINLTVNADGLHEDVEFITVVCFVCRDQSCLVGAGRIGASQAFIATNGASSVNQDVTVEITTLANSRTAPGDATNYQCEMRVQTGSSLAVVPAADAPDHARPADGSQLVVRLNGPLNQ